jgi:hypothetical protein
MAISREQTLTRQIQEIEAKLEHTKDKAEHDKLYAEYVRLDMELEDSYYSRHYRDEDDWD